MVEERIYISVEAINPCAECTTFMNCVKPCEKQKEWKESGYGFGVSKKANFTRTEAIEKMREAVKQYEIGYDEIEDVDCALEAALNALLDGK